MTRSVLAAKLYAFTYDFNLEAVFKVMLINILDRFIFFVFCINLKSLYDYLIKFDTTQKKRFMINVMNLQQLYKRRKIIEMK